MIRSRTLASTVALSACLASGAMAAGSDQAALIKPITKEQTIVFIPKVIHPWYEVVKAGSMFAAAELAKQGIKVNVIWDQPP